MRDAAESLDQPVLGEELLDQQSKPDAETVQDLLKRKY